MAEAMALALVTKLGSVAMGNLEELAKEKFLNDYGLLVSVESEAQKLEPKLKLIQAVLDDAELKQMHQETVKVWMESLKQIMYEADDVLDEWHTRASIFQSQITEASNFSRKAFSFLSSQYCSCIAPLLPILFGNEFQLLSVRIDIARRIQGITTSLDTLSVNMQQLNLISNPTAEVNSLRTDRQTTSIVDVAEVFGRDNDKKAIVKLLLSESSKAQRDVPVISIVGAGGFGKTTLAKLVLEDEDIVNTFEPLNIWWVCVSEPFERERIAREINERATQQKHDGGLEDLHQTLRKSIGGKRFLLVLDDVWSENSDDWDPLRIALACGEQGSRILITTRNVKVAQMKRSSPNNMHKLGILSPEGCWSLFQHIAFQGREDDIKRLKDVGEELVAKCGGVPLAVKILAAHMRSQNTSDWRNVLANEIWKVQHQKFFPAFFLSYQALRSSLKQCLIYCCVFPKDAIIVKGELVTLWMAQGFLGSDGREELEVIGADCFHDLVMASFFQVLKEDYDADGNIVRCKMHDLVHDFCQFLSGKECLVTSASPTEDMCGDQVRHMNVEYVQNFPIYRAKNLRTLILWPLQLVTSAVFHQLTCLRSLVLKKSGLEQLPNEVGSLLHLRYVDLSWTDLRELPETMCNLYNLQTLKLRGCEKLSKLPEEIGRLSNLRHLDIRKTDSLRYFPQSIGRLSHLRTLRKFIISERCKIQELGSLNHLSGALELDGLRHVGSVDEAKRAQLHQKEKLRHLELNFRYLSYENEEDDDEYGMERMEGVLESLRPHVNLEELVIWGYPGSKFPFWMSRESLPKIVKLELRTWKNLTELPCLGNLEYLETLTIAGLESVKHITSEFYGVGVETSFPMLKKLELWSMTRLEDWNIPFSNFKKVMPRLCDLWLWDCPKLREVPALGRLESLEKLIVSGLNSVQNVAGDILRISDSSSSPDVVLFPSLTELSLERFPEWQAEQTGVTIMPAGLRKLRISNSEKLKVLPHYMFSHSLRELELRRCPQLTGTQPCLPPLLEKLTLRGDVGVLSKSLLPIIPHGNNNNNKYLNLRSVSIWGSPHSSLPEGLRRFTSLERLQLLKCKWLDFKPEELAYFPMLQKLEIDMCNRIRKRCIREDWGNQLCHQIPFKIIIERSSILSPFKIISADGLSIRLIKGN